MPYCIDCGVKVIDNSKECPLCTRELEYPRREGNRYPHFPITKGRVEFLKVKKSNPFLLSLITLFTLLVSVIPLGIDFITDTKITWSLYTLSSFFYLYLTGAGIVIYRGRGFLIYTSININTALFLFTLDLISPKNSWFLEYALTGFIFLQGISLLTALIVRNQESRLIKSSIIILALAIFLFILDYSILSTTTWSIITGSILIPTSIFLITVKFLLKDF